MLETATLGPLAMSWMGITMEHRDLFKRLMIEDMRELGFSSKAPFVSDARVSHETLRIILLFSGLGKWCSRWSDLRRSQKAWGVTLEPVVLDASWDSWKFTVWWVNLIDGRYFYSFLEKLLKLLVEVTCKTKAKKRIVFEVSFVFGRSVFHEREDLGKELQREDNVMSEDENHGISCRKNLPKKVEKIFDVREVARDERLDTLRR